MKERTVGVIEVKKALLEDWVQAVVIVNEF
jgi:hypothetical protein